MSAARAKAKSTVKAKNTAKATAAAPRRTARKRRPAPARPAASDPSWASRVPQLRPGLYADGLPLHDVTYLSCKMMLRPNRFVSRQSLLDFAEVLKEPAERIGVGLKTRGFRDEPLELREVLFVDTHDFRLYRNAFILRRRIPYQEGFPVGDPEIVFKFRHPDIQVAAETDVRPRIPGDHRVKFKCQALPLRDRLGGYRLLYSHNVQFPRSAMGYGTIDVLSLDRMIEVFPVLERVRKGPGERIQLVSETIIEEVLQDIAQLDFGHGLTAKANVALWRTRGEHRPLVGEFSFGLRFADRRQLAAPALRKVEEYYLALQFAAREWISLASTKTGAVYHLKGSPPTSHE
jgi:hypothetical protein